MYRGRLTLGTEQPVKAFGNVVCAARVWTASEQAAAPMLVPIACPDISSTRDEPSTLVSAALVLVCGELYALRASTSICKHAATSLCLQSTAISSRGHEPGTVTEDPSS